MQRCAVTGCPCSTAMSLHAWTALIEPSVLPLPPRAKKSPPKGYTGKGGKVPTPEQTAAWVKTKPNGNTALRLPGGVVGIDVDDYGDKSGGRTLAEAALRAFVEDRHEQSGEQNRGG